MHGIIFEVLEDWIIKEYGIESWQAIKKAAGSTVKDNAFLRRAYYRDADFFDLLHAISNLLSTSTDDVLISYGRYFVIHSFQNGYDELLRCQGSTLRQWLSNLNAMHEFIQRSFPGKKFIAPIFWCEDCEEVEGTILLHYYSLRGSGLAPLVVGIVSELASCHFQLEINMEQLALQGSDEAKFTSWRVSAVDESQRWKLSPSASLSNKEEQEEVSFEGVSIPSTSRCPFSGRSLGGTETDTGKHQTAMETDDDDDGHAKPATCPFHHQSLQLQKELSQSSSTSSTDDTCSVNSLSEISKKDIGFDFRVDHLNELFPFHVLVDRDFSIVHVGDKLPKILQKTAEELCGSHIGDIVQITRPILASWDWKSLHKLADQHFSLTPTSKVSSLHHKVSMVDSILRFKAAMFRISENQVLFTLSPDAKNVKDLNLMGLTLSDLPLSGFQRDAVFLGEHVTQEANKAHELDKLSKKLAVEKDLSNTLLNNMLPQKVAEELRSGKTVEPAYHDNVTLFFSDIVNFTKICDQVETWDVIDMMNQLYSVMDFLASHFDLYKVETVGDAYMCCSGLPDPDEYHAEKVANFALAVLECIKHVKSPVDGSPIQIRIGIHTGSCTSGVIGTLTPHYALFGDMVNTAARHESTGIAGKIQISSLLYGRLKHFSKESCPQYNFKARGLVDMKGKGEQYTYWLESGTEGNVAANPEMINSLSEKVEAMLNTKVWKKRRYFGNGGNLVGDRTEGSTVGSRCTASVQSSFSPDDDCNSVHSTDADLADDIEDAMPTTIIDFPEGETLHLTKPWPTLGSHEEKSSEEAIFESLLESLDSCIQKGGSRLQIIQDQLQAFVASIANIYRNESGEQALTNIAGVLLRSSFLWESRDKESTNPHYALGANPWDQFVLLFSAFVHKVKHTGSSNATLQEENHLVAQMYEGLQSCQQRRSVDFSFAILEEECGDLYDEITFSCPNFRSLVRKAVLCTDLERESAVHEMLSRCEKLNSTVGSDERLARQRNDANIGLVLALATVGPYTQSREQFLQISLDHFEKKRKLSGDELSDDDCGSWYYEQSMFMKDIVLPLVEQALSVLPKATYLEDGAADNIAFWDQRGKEWLRGCTLKNAKVDAPEASKLSRYHIENLVAANVKILENILAEVVTTSTKTTRTNEIETAFLEVEAILAEDVDNKIETVCLEADAGADELNPYEDIALGIAMKKAPTTSNTATDSKLVLPTKVRAELRDLVMCIAAGYVNNRFHNFEHASHVAHLAYHLLKGIHPSEESNGARDIAHDPLARFALVFSALVHDVGHSGVPNGQRSTEQPDLAKKYQNKSIAEQNSIDRAWNIFMSPSFKNLRHSLFESRGERDRFRQLLVNCVMATDIFDPNLKVLRQTRWAKAFATDSSLLSTEEERHYKAAIAIEHIMQASDVAHTMQDWEIYRQWNENLFREMYEAYLQGRADKDPSKTWYGGELWFFDNWVIPLAQNLKNCGVLDIVSDLLVKEAQRNRQRWEKEGEKICEEMLSNYMALREMERSSVSSDSTGSYLTAQVVSEVESLSKVMARYERKYESALGSLIAITYKGQSFGEELLQKELSHVHQHFKQQDWYRLHVDCPTHSRSSNPAA